MHSENEKIEPTATEASDAATNNKRQVNSSHIESIEFENYHGLSLHVVLVLLALSVCLIASNMVLVGSGALSRDIAATFGGSTKTIWLTQVIGIITASLAPPVAQASDFWGRKWIVIIFIVLGAVGAIIMSRASSMNNVIAGAVISGLVYGSNGVLHAIFSEILPRRWRTTAQAITYVVVAGSSIFGLMIGTYLVMRYDEGWRIFFYIVAGFLVFSAVLTAFFYNPPPRELQLQLSFKEKVQRLDKIGSCLLIIFLVLFSMALTWVGNPYSSTSAHVLANLLLGLASMVALIIHQTFFRKDGLFHHGLFKRDRNFALVLVIVFCEGLGYYVTVGYMIFEISVLFTSNGLLAGLRYTVYYIALAVSSVLVGLISSRWRIIREPIAASLALYTIFNGLMVSVATDSNSAVWGYCAFGGFGLGLCLSALIAAAQLSAPPELIAVSTGLVISVRSLGGTIGLAICTSIFNSKLSKNLSSSIAKAVVPLGLPETSLGTLISALLRHDNSTELLAEVRGITPDIIVAGAYGLRQGYADTFQYLWITGVCFTFVGAVAACFLTNPKKDLNMHVDAPIERE